MEDKVSIQIIKTMATLMTTAFALVAGLAWNEAIKGLIKEFIPSGSTTMALVIYAIFVTVIAVIITVFIGKLIGKMGIELED